MKIYNLLREASNDDLKEVAREIHKMNNMTRPTSHKKSKFLKELWESHDGFYFADILQDLSALIKQEVSLRFINNDL